VRSLVIVIASVVTAGGVAAPAAADVVLATQVGIGGGVGAAPRPIYTAHAGIEAAIVIGHGWGVAVSLDQLVIERPSAPTAGGAEYQANLCAYWRKPVRSGVAWVAFGAGWRRFQVDAPDGELGSVTLHGINVLHIRTGADWPIGDRVFLGVAFDWTIGYYRSGEYDGAASAAYVQRHDMAPPPIDAGWLGQGANVYSVGPRLSVVID
jgi:hypothetical protein